MKKIPKHIEIVSSAQSSLSSMSHRSREAALAVLSKHYVTVGITLVDSLADLERVVARRPDLVFLGMKFVPLRPHLGIRDPHKIWLADYLDRHGIAYTGSNKAAHELELYKPLAKQRALEAGLKTSPFYTVAQDQPQSEAMTLSYPVFIKPTNRGGGVGVDARSVARNVAEVRAKVASIATRLQSDALIEEYLPGREFSVAIFAHPQTSKVSAMPIELVAERDANGQSVISGALKSLNAEVVLPVLDPHIRQKVSTLALGVFRALGARDYGRIDIRLDALGVPHFLEANLLPSLISGYGSFPKACVLSMGLAYEPMILRIVELGFSRQTSTTKKPLLTPRQLKFS